MYETICSPLNYGGLTLKNRIVFAPSSLGLPQEELVERMKGVTFHPEDVRAVLNDSPVGELFGGITADEVTATIFDL